MRQTPEQKQAAMAALIKAVLRDLGEPVDEITTDEKNLLYGFLLDLEK